MELLEIEDTSERRLPARCMGEYVPELVPGYTSAPAVKPLEITQPEGRRSPSTATCSAGRTGRCGLGFNYREGLVLHTGRLRRRRPLRPDRPPHLVRRDGRALPRPDADHVRAHRLRHRRVGPRLHDHLARAGLRLPGRDPLPGRGAARHHRRAGDDQERDLHPRGGRRGPVEARRRRGRRRGAPVAAAGGLLPRHRGQLRVPRLLALLPGRQHRVRGAGHRDHGDHAASPRASSRPTARWSTSTPTRPIHQHFIVARLDLEIDGADNTVS